jgi:hypothetical protein
MLGRAARKNLEATVNNPHRRGATSLLPQQTRLFSGHVLHPALGTPIAILLLVGRDHEAPATVMEDFHVYEERNRPHPRGGRA